MTAPKDLHLASIREEYSLGGLDERDALPDPLAMLRRWLHDAVAAGLYDPTGMVLSTVDPDGSPSSRMVLCKGLDDQGLVFYTGYDSAKARAIEHEPRVAVLFPWHPLQRQVRVVGPATEVSAEESDTYFAGRPRASQLSAAASPQSQPVESRRALDELLAQTSRALCRPRRGAPVALGRLPHHPHVVRVLAGEDRPAARPAALRPRPRGRPRRLADHPAGALTTMPSVLCS